MVGAEKVLVKFRGTPSVGWKKRAPEKKDNISSLLEPRVIPGTGFPQ